MRKPLSRRLPLLMVLAWAVNHSSPRLSAQAIGARFVVAHSSNSLLGGLTGGNLGVVLPFRDPKLSWRIDIERITQNSSGIGITCAGLIDPSVCFPEPVRASGRSTSAAAGITYDIAGRGAASLGFLADLRFAQFHSTIHGAESGRVLRASKGMLGGEIGAVLTLLPRRKSIVSLELGGALGAMTPFRTEQVVDGYTPFDGESTLARLWLGINLRLGRRS